MRSLLSRLKRLEDVRAVQRRVHAEVQFGRFIKELPPEYNGEKHVRVVGRLPNGDYEWEERRGPDPHPEDGDPSKMLIRVSFVSPRGDEEDVGQV